MSARSQTRQRISGLYGLADAAASGGDPVRLGVQLLAGGCRLIQLRCKDWPEAEVERAALELARRCRQVGATFLINDDAALAAAVDADGVHLGQLDSQAAIARRLIGPDRILGRSTHGLDQVRDAMAHADYIAFGPVYDTENLSRPKATRGLELLALTSGLLKGAMPLVAIGGITPARLSAVRDTGGGCLGGDRRHRHRSRPHRCSPVDVGLSKTPDEGVAARD